MDLNNLFPHLSIWIGEFIFLPLFVFFIFRKNNVLKGVPVTIWLFIFFLALFLFPIFLPRKHIELKLFEWNSSFWFVTLGIQMHNNFYEETAKLISLLLAILLFRERIKEPLKERSGALLIGFWAGLAYGIGEALTLTLISYNPELGRLFGINLFLLFVTWYWVWERFLAIIIHAVMGSLVGLGIHWVLKGRKWTMFLLFFILAILYHELVDGTVLFIRYFPTNPLAEFIGRNLLFGVLPFYVGIGLTFLFFLGRFRRGTPPIGVSNMGKV